MGLNHLGSENLDVSSKSSPRNISMENLIKCGPNNFFYVLLYAGGEIHIVLEDLLSRYIYTYVICD